MAMQLLRRLDAVGAPYSIAVGRCVRAPAGLHLGLMVGGAQSYCVQTMRQTGDADQSRAAHKGGGKKGGWSGGGGGSGGYRQNRDGWDHARSGWGGPAPFRGSVLPPGAANMTPPTAQAAQAAQAAPAAAAPQPHPRPHKQPRKQPRKQPLLNKLHLLRHRQTLLNKLHLLRLPRLQRHKRLSRSIGAKIGGRMAVSGGTIVTSTRMVAWTHMTIGQKTSRWRRAAQSGTF